MKKIKILLLCFITLMFFGFNQVNASTTIELDTATGSIGDSVTLNLSLNDNPEFGLIGVKLEFDTEVLEYLSAQIVGLDGALMKDVANNNNIVTMYALTISDLLKDTGTILKVEFKIKDTDKTSSEIKVKVTNFGIDETEALEYESKNGFVYIKTNVSSDDSISLQDEIKSDDTDKNITWHSSDEEIATVDEEGNVSFLKDGEVTISATNEDGEEVYSKDYVVGEKIKDEDNSKSYVVYIIISIVLCVIVVGLILKKVLYEKNKENKNKKKSKKKAKKMGI